MKYAILKTGTISAFILFILGCGSGPDTNNEADTSTYQEHAASQMNGSLNERKSPATAAFDNDTLKIVFPKGGEELVKGKTYTFEWTGGDSAVTIFLVDSSLESEGNSVSLADRIYGIPNKGTYHYTFPKKIQEGTYQVRIGKKQSGYFKVVGQDTTQ